MSLPTPNTNAVPAMDPVMQQATDAALIALANQTGGDLRQMLFAFFSFLNRRTDFYLVPNQEDVKEGVPISMGFREGDAEKLLLAAFRQFPLRRMPRQGSSKGNVHAKEPKSAGKCVDEKDQKKEKKTQPKTGAEAKTSSPKSTPAQTGTPKSNTKADKESKVRLTEDGNQVPVGNGGKTGRYTWTQTLDEVSVLLAVPEGTRGKDLNVTLKTSQVSVRLKNAQETDTKSPTLLDGELVHKIRTDESTWSLEGGVLVLNLDKLKKTWWETVMVGDAKIDTTLVDSRRNIDTYDDSTQAAIRKILFDQRQERLGLPTSDEIEGGKPDAPPLPSGVEYIGKETLDKINKGKSGS